MANPNTKSGTTGAKGMTTTERRENYQFSFNLTPAERLFLESRLDEAKGLKTISDVLRSFIHAEQSLFSVPPMMAERLRQDMKEQRRTQHEYLADLLTHRFMDLSAGPSSRKS